MRRKEVSDEVLRFLEQYIDSVPHLEALLLLRERHGDAWSEEMVATRTYVAKDRARAVLRDLVRLGLIAVGPEPAVYRYDPTAEHELTIAQVADAYRLHLVPIATLIHAKGSAAVRDFARAFEIKRRD